ncbi:MAG: hypothetical protein HDS87_00010 [Bacteroidales bacterium]|nr:hypothetical protein [Bacteroidales bacterium]
MITDNEQQTLQEGVGSDEHKTEDKGTAMLLSAPKTEVSKEDLKVPQLKGVQLSEEEEAVLGLDRQIAMLAEAAERSKVEDEATRLKREKRERSRKKIAAITDGLSALSNIFFTTQYAPDMYKPQNSMSEKVRARIEEARKERKENEDRHMNIMLKLGDAQTARAKTLRDIKAQHEAQKLAREKAERDAEAHIWQALLQRDKQREQKGLADKRVYEAESARQESLNKPDELKLKNEYIKAGIGQRNASATASRAAATNSIAQAEVARNKGFYGTFDGKKYYTKVDYDKAVLNAVEEYNSRNPKYVKKTRQVQGEDGKYYDEEYEEYEPEVPTTWDKQTAYGSEPQTYETSNLAAIIEPRLKLEREEKSKGKGGQPADNTPPSRRSNDDNVPPSRRK